MNKLGLNFSDFWIDFERISPVALVLDWPGFKKGTIVPLRGFVDGFEVIILEQNIKNNTVRCQIITNNPNDYIEEI